MARVLMRLRGRLVQEAVRRQLLARGVQIGEGTRFHGRPLVELAEDSLLRLGAGVVLTSWSTHTALGVNHPVVIRTLRPGAVIEIGDDVGISGGSICAAMNVSIGAGTMLGANVTMVDTDFHPVRHGRRRHAPLPEPRPQDAVTVGTNLFIGTGAIVLKGSTIGDDAVIGAGAVVRGVVPAGAIVAGNPAQEIRPSQAFLLTTDSWPKPSPDKSVPVSADGRRLWGGRLRIGSIVGGYDAPAESVLGIQLSSG